MLDSISSFIASLNLGTSFCSTFWVNSVRVSVNCEMGQRRATQMGQEFENLKGKGIEKKFLTLLTQRVEQKDVPRFKLAIKEEME